VLFKAYGLDADSVAARVRALI